MCLASTKKPTHKSNPGPKPFVVRTKPTILILYLIAINDEWIKIVDWVENHYTVVFSHTKTNSKENAKNAPIYELETNPENSCLIETKHQHPMYLNKITLHPN